MPRRPLPAPLLRVLPVAVVVAVVVVAVAWPARLAVQRPAQDVDRGTTPPARVVERDTTLSARTACDRVTDGFVPQSISVPGATSGAAVITPPRDVNGIPGTPPLTTAGKSLFAWDRQQGTRPGDRAGNVLLNAHTWPDGSALGNRLLAALHVGGRLVVRGPEGRLCYRVTERVEVPADIQMYRYYDVDGPPQLAILVCSGTRLGPGVWTKRTVWFASPVTSGPAVS
jgi:hypothetical protein